MEIRLFSKKQNDQQFERLAAENERQVYAVCFHMMKNREDAADCAQEALLRAYRAFSTWITRIAMNVCTDELRRRKSTLSLEEMAQDQGFDPPDSAPTAYARLEQKERMRLLREALDQLPDDMRGMIVMRDMRGMNYDEIAQALEVPLGTVKSRISRAREKLSRILRQSSELFSSTSV